jgi:hypothetical protein
VAEVVYRESVSRLSPGRRRGDEWRAIWDRARDFYSGYDFYAKRIRDRPIQIMVLAESTDF